MNVFSQQTTLLLLLRPRCVDCQWDDRLIFSDNNMARAFLLLLFESTELLQESGGAVLLNSVILKLTNITICPQYVMLWPVRCISVSPYLIFLQ